MWEGFSASDPRFAELARRLGGARVLRQDPLECLIQFLCSSNNNIARITRMVDFVSSLGSHLGTVGGLDFYEFPSLERLSRVSEGELREAGFGYRLDFDPNSDPDCTTFVLVCSIRRLVLVVRSVGLDLTHY